MIHIVSYCLFEIRLLVDRHSRLIPPKPCLEPSILAQNWRIWAGQHVPTLRTLDDTRIFGASDDARTRQKSPLGSASV